MRVSREKVGMKLQSPHPGGLFLGTSGWNYRHWSEGVFYPHGSRPSEWLGYYAGVFHAVEINTTFYQLPAARVFTRWHAGTPADFTFAVKASRFITHMKKLADPEPHVSRFLDRVAELRGKLGAVLFQLPPNWKFNPQRLAGLLTFMSRQTIVPRLRVAVEFRHPSWLCGECHRILRDHHAALVLADAPARGCDGPLTADFVYLRRHGQVALPAASLRKDAVHIRRWLAQGRDVHIYFNNDVHGHAVRDARRLGDLLKPGGSP